MARKTQGWEKRLSDYIESVKDQPFVRGVHDCALFAGVCAEVMTEQDFTEQFRRPYKTKKEAYEFLKSIGFDGLAAIPNKLLGEPYPNVAHAKRGDGALIECEGEEALGIIDMTGRRAVTVSKDGLKFYDIKYVTKAWEI